MKPKTDVTCKRHKTPFQKKHELMRLLEEKRKKLLLDVHLWFALLAMLHLSGNKQVFFFYIYQTR